MKKLLAIFSLLAFVAVYAAPALTIPQDQAKVKTSKVEERKASKAAKTEASASCCETEKGAAKSSCCTTGKEEGKSCASTCKEAASCKGATTAEKKK